MPIELKPCPFCGKTPEVMKQYFKFCLFHGNCIITPRLGWLTRDEFKGYVEKWNKMEVTNATWYFLTTSLSQLRTLTSHLAEEGHKKTREYNIGLVLSSVKRFPKETRNFHSNLLGMDKIEVSRRLSDLKAMSKVFIFGSIKCPTARRPLSTWEAL